MSFQTISFIKYGGSSCMVRTLDFDFQNRVETNGTSFLSVIWFVLLFTLYFQLCTLQ
jgi:hypothetical protein